MFAALGLASGLLGGGGGGGGVGLPSMSNSSSAESSASNSGSLISGGSQGSIPWYVWAIGGVLVLVLLIKR